MRLDATLKTATAKPNLALADDASPRKDSVTLVPAAIATATTLTGKKPSSPLLLLPQQPVPLPMAEVTWLELRCSQLNRLDFPSALWAIDQKALPLPAAKGSHLSPRYSCYASDHFEGCKGTGLGQGGGVRNSSNDPNDVEDDRLHLSY